MNLPGIPPLLNQIANVNNIGVLLLADAGSVLNMIGVKPMWGIYLNGNPIAIADNVSSIEYRQGSRISEAPMEEGAFQSYNKVATPFNVRIQLTKGGNEAARSKFLADIEKAAASLDLYDVITPERTYASANIEHFDYRRTSRNGAGLLTVDVWLLEVRLTGNAIYSNTKAASGAMPVSGGVVQAQTPTATQAAPVAAKIATVKAATPVGASGYGATGYW